MQITYNQELNYWTCRGEGGFTCIIQVLANGFFMAKGYTRKGDMTNSPPFEKFSEVKEWCQQEADKAGAS